jgi:hypothetical protein
MAVTEMDRRLNKISREVLVRLAIMYCMKNGLTHLPSRTQKRHKKGMICWYCKYAPDFPEGFAECLVSADDPDNIHIRPPADLIAKAKTAINQICEETDPVVDEINQISDHDHFGFEMVDDFDQEEVGWLTSLW